MKSNPENILAISVPKAAYLLGVSRATFYRYQTHPEFPRILRFCGRSFVIFAELQEWLNTLGEDKKNV